MSSKPYRPCVVGVFVNEDGQLLIAERKDYPGSWQFPQGGVEDGETDQEAVFREVFEELGNNQFEVLDECSSKFSYDFPINSKSPIAKNFRGQIQTWFKLRYKDGEEPDLNAALDKEFIDWKWVTVNQAMAECVEWKLDTYRSALIGLGLLEENSCQD